ncbi:zinc finger protein ZPR1 homolog [Macadamia integrifolia]|uniref:zinc finger protein ZPR1 homolog n=1 Tax=Macadamia integrifolia TaxID=60698 RepID=UPI001C4F6DFB|nr:zinc finger protein ZPR1 homolog [Macadamia integrifolia]XP_042502653.1 zinc finger protein ZPR1 homolog [Macadamia integrifolia]XP_042502660.1 zinc finger protein ZPR1 homolog [Macadamia integrifolia]XP_042502667.1 zinc finger protein ZPR1 homolog [Macadamia integrifolia]
MASRDPIVDVGSAVEAVSADDVLPLHQIESLCMRCEENGTTRLLLTSIPHFREIVVMAFECPHCGERNNEVQFAGELQPRGCLYRLEVPSGDQKMLNRQVIKSDSATIKIPELDFEIPPEAQRGKLSTIEGILLRAVDELQALQEERKKVVPETAEALDQFLMKLKSYVTGDVPFTFILDDPAGNSFIENPFAPSSDPSLTIKFYERTPEQQEALGFLVDSSQSGEHETESAIEALTDGRRGDSNETKGEPHGSIGAVAGHRAIAQGNSEEVAAALFRYSAPEEVMTFPSTCGACSVRCETRMFVTKIPYFQEVIVMASSCDACGYRSSELKPGGRIPEKGKKIKVCVQSVGDLSRDVIKSDTASVKIPEIDLELASGTLGGVVTTIEGLITKISGSLERVHGFTFGDSLDDQRRSKWLEFRVRLNKLLSLEEPWTLIIDDALANSFVAPITDALENDHQLTFEEYVRSWEQNEELGLNDMDTSAADVDDSMTN